MEQPGTSPPPLSSTEQAELMLVSAQMCSVGLAAASRNNPKEGEPLGAAGDGRSALQGETQNNNSAEPASAERDFALTKEHQIQQPNQADQ